MYDQSLTDAWLNADRVARANPGLTADDIRRMPMSDFARLIGRDPIHPAPTRPAPGVAPQVEDTRDDTEHEPQSVSVRDMSNDEYAAFREARGMNRVDQGIFGSGSFREASKAKAGRNAMVTSNVIPAPRISRVTQSQANESMRDTRSLSDRFSAPGNFFTA